MLSSRVVLISKCAGRRFLSVPVWATVNPDTMSSAAPAIGKNLVGGTWMETKTQHTVIDPLNGDPFMLVPNTAEDEIGPYVERMKTCPRSGLHNPIKNVERYNMLGEVMVKGAHELGKPEVAEFFAKLIQRLVPKSYPQCIGEPTVTRKWMENYGCDQVRYLARSFGIPGDHSGQTSVGMRMPFGAVSVITPFNFPLEICALQTCSALFMGNQPLCKVDWKVAICMEQFIRMLHHVVSLLNVADRMGLARRGWDGAVARRWRGEAGWVGSRWDAARWGTGVGYYEMG